MEKKYDFKRGFFDGLPIGLAYLAVSFSFGIYAVQHGLPYWLATILSASNITSAGQFAGVTMMAELAAIVEIFFTVLVINARYFLMSLSLSQQLDEKTPAWKRLIMAYFITDEIFAVASMSRKNLNFKYFMGIAILPLLGWTFGTLLGGLINNALPASLQNALAIALYCMFIALIIPPARKSKGIVVSIAISVLITCIFYYTPYLKDYISSGIRVIIASIISAAITAWLFPIKTEDDENAKNEDKNNEEVEACNTK